MSKREKVFQEIVGFRLSPDDRKKLDKAVKKMHVTKSQFLRQSIKSVLTKKSTEL